MNSTNSNIQTATPGNGWGDIRTSLVIGGVHVVPGDTFRIAVGDSVISFVLMRISDDGEQIEIMGNNADYRGKKSRIPVADFTRATKNTFLKLFNNFA